MPYSRVPRSIDSSELLDLVGTLYDAALGDQPWDRTLAAVAEAAGAEAVTCFLVSRVDGRVAFQASAGIDPVDWQRYEQHYIGVDVRLGPSLALDVGRPVTEEEVLPREVYRRSEIYNDFYRRIDFPHMAAFVAERSAEVLGVFAVQGCARRGPFDTESLRVLQALAPHVRRALRMQFALTRTPSARPDSDVLEQQHQAWLIVDRTGRILWRNDPAATLFGAESGLSDLGSQLRIRPAAAQRELAARLHAFASRRVDETGTPILSSSRPGEPPCELVIGRVPKALASRFPSACALILLRPPPRGSDRARLLRSRFGLTPRECEVARLVGEGARPAQIAATLGVSVATARTQLKRCFAKTGARSQLDLYRLWQSMN